MSRFFQPYEGKRPFLFVSYSHRNSGEVLETIERLNRKLRIWYDEGIPAGSDWPSNIQTHMASCGAVLFFLSRTALASPNCLSEIRTAVSLKRPVVYIRLDDSDPEGEWRELLANCLPLECGATAASREQAVLDCPKIGRRFTRRWTDQIPWNVFGFLAALLFFLAAAIGLILVLSGTFDPDEAVPGPTTKPTPTLTAAPTGSSQPSPSIDPDIFPVTFPDTEQEDAVRAQLNRYTGPVLRTELSSVTELYFCGNMYLNAMDTVSCIDGAFYVGSSRVVEGKVYDLSVIGSMSFLKKLALVYQPVKDLKPLTNLTLLEELYLSGDSVTDLSALGALPSLRTLHLEHSAVRDLSPLSAFPALKTVTVSAEMLPVIVPQERSYELILIP